MSKKILAVLMPVLGILYISAYIRSATMDVVYTDYIRLVNTYLDNVFSIEPYLSADVLTRLPINYIERIINVVFFSYSTTFDMMLGALCLGMMGFLFGAYISKRDYSIATLIIVMLVVFSLQQWEMITNGTGWVHFLSVMLFILHFYIYDRYLETPSKFKTIFMHILPIFTIIMTAGSYTLAYVAALFFGYGIQILRKKDVKVHGGFFLASFIPLILFLISYALSTTYYAGATQDSMLEIFLRAPQFFIIFLVNSFASVLIGIELVETYHISHYIVFILGILVLGAYVCACYMQFREKYYQKSILPLLLLIYGICSHLMVMMTRWIFLDVLYGMSARYALQYGVGFIGVILTFTWSHKKKRAYRWLYIVLFLYIVGNLWTASHEIHMAQYRKENFETMKNTALAFEEVDDDTLKTVMQYHTPSLIREALQILKDRNLNVFRQE